MRQNCLLKRATKILYQTRITTRTTNSFAQVSLRVPENGHSRKCLGQDVISLDCH